MECKPLNPFGFAPQGYDMSDTHRNSEHPAAPGTAPRKCDTQELYSSLFMNALASIIILQYTPKPILIKAPIIL